MGSAFANYLFEYLKNGVGMFQIEVAFHAGVLWDLIFVFSQCLDEWMFADGQSELFIGLLNLCWVGFGRLVKGMKDCGSSFTLESRFEILFLYQLSSKSCTEFSEPMFLAR